MERFGCRGVVIFGRNESIQNSIVSECQFLDLESLSLFLYFHHPPPSQSNFHNCFLYLKSIVLIDSGLREEGPTTDR